MKLSPEAERIAPAMPSVESTITAASTLGRMWRNMILRSRQPEARAACT
jgi:hypothetical protein